MRTPHACNSWPRSRYEQANEIVNAFCQPSAAKRQHMNNTDSEPSYDEERHVCLIPKAETPSSGPLVGVKVRVQSSCYEPQQGYNGYAYRKI